jgi:hypothetical protein
LKIHFNIILPSTPGSPHQNPVCICLFPHTCYMLRPSNSFRFDYPNNITSVVAKNNNVWSNCTRRRTAGKVSYSELLHCRWQHSADDPGVLVVPTRCC